MDPQAKGSQDPTLRTYLCVYIEKVYRASTLSMYLYHFDFI